MRSSTENCVVVLHRQNKAHADVCGTTVASRVGLAMVRPDRRLQRLAFVGITESVSTVLMAAPEILLGFPPVNLLTQYETRPSALRLSIVNICFGKGSDIAYGRIHTRLIEWAMSFKWALIKLNHVFIVRLPSRWGSCYSNIDYLLGP
jgi:hypothetical protein